MRKYSTIIFLILCMGASVEAQSTRPNLLRDGFILSGIEGNIKYSDSRGSLFFEFDSDIKDDKGVIKAGTSLQLLDSATLEKLIADFGSNTAGRYRLDGRITKYKGSNYIYPTYFQAVVKQKTEGTQSLPGLGGIPKTENTTDANDPFALPAEVRTRLLQSRTVVVSRSSPKTDSNNVPNGQAKGTVESQSSIPADFMLTGRTAFLVEKKDGEWEFQLDSLGRNLSNISYKLLPCELLEQSENMQSAVPEPIMFNITGIVTRYKGNDYILPIKVMRFYNHGNFGG
jgi:hypothetical protein